MDGEGRKFSLNNEQLIFLRRMLYRVGNALAMQITKLQSERFDYDSGNVDTEQEERLFNLIRLYAMCENLYCMFSGREININGIMHKMDFDVNIKFKHGQNEQVNRENESVE